MQDNPGMKEAARLDADEVSILLIGTEEEQNDAIRLIDKYLRFVISGIIRNVAIYLKSEEVQEVYQEVLLGLWRAARDGRYDADRPLLPFVFTIARCRAIDRIRRKSLRKRKIGNELVLDAIAGALADTKVGEAWGNIVSKNDGPRMMATIRKAIIRMPERQRQVASVMIDLYPEEPSLQEIREEVCQRTGEDLTVLAIKSARREARKKIREELVRAGYMERKND